MRAGDPIVQLPARREAPAGSKPPALAPVAPPRGHPMLKLAIFGVIVAAAMFAAWRMGLVRYADASAVAGLIREMRTIRGVAAIFVLVHAASTAVGIPGIVLTLVGGAVFGTLVGTVLNWVATLLGAIGAYYLARTLGRGAVRRLLGVRAAALDRFLRDRGMPTLLRLRLIPIMPYNALNFAAGFAAARPRDYMVSTAVGILPSTAIYTYFADSLVAGIAGTSERAMLHVAFASVLLIVLSFLPALFRRGRRVVRHRYRRHV